MKRILNKQIVKDAIEHLKGEGKNPTIDNIRQITGGGNPLIMKLRAELVNDNTIVINSNIVTINSNAQSNLATRLERLEQKVAVLESHGNRSDNNVTVDSNNALLEEIADLRKCLAMKNAEIAELKAELAFTKNQINLFGTNESGKDKEIDTLKQELTDTQNELQQAKQQPDTHGNNYNNTLQSFVTKWKKIANGKSPGGVRSSINSMLNDLESHFTTTEHLSKTSNTQMSKRVIDTLITNATTATIITEQQPFCSNQ